jgi:glycosyltransferase involved in cell wall biosynthesis
LFSNDLDTLLPNFLIARLRNQALIYDTHEYFTGVPELSAKPFVRGIWKSLEAWMFPKLKKIITVNESIAELYFKDYGCRPFVVRNVPRKPASIPLKSRDELGIPEGKKIVLYQGAGINMDRGLEEAIQAMAYLDDAILLIVGGGDVMSALKKEVIRLGLYSKVVFAGKFLPDELPSITPLADLGLSIDKDTNINYRFSLPNKLFDYIHAGVPVLASRLTEVERIVSDYKVGAFIESHDSKHIADALRTLLSNEELLLHYKSNCEKAAAVLNWSHEKQILLNLINS